LVRQAGVTPPPKFQEKGVLLAVEEGAELVWRNVAAGLSENCMAGAGVQLTVIRHNQRLVFAAAADPA
jgi:hypothetical protein